MQPYFHVSKRTIARLKAGSVGDGLYNPRLRTFAKPITNGYGTLDDQQKTILHTFVVHYAVCMSSSLSVSLAPNAGREERPGFSAKEVTPVFAHSKLLVTRVLRTLSNSYDDEGKESLKKRARPVSELTAVN